MKSLWPTAPTVDHRRARLPLLRESSTPATHEDAIYWLARFLHHFPTKAGERDAVIISDLANDIVGHGIAVVPMVDSLDELRHEATPQNPWLPASGIIFRRMQQKNGTLKNILMREAIDLLQDDGIVRISHG